MDAIGVNIAGLERILNNCSQLEDVELCGRTNISGDHLFQAIYGSNYSGTTGDFYFQDVNRESKSRHVL